MTDERKGLPSASSAGRYALCPGSFMLEKQAPPEVESDDAARGTRIHDWLAGLPVELTDDEMRVAELCSTQEGELVGATFGDDAITVTREERLWSRGNWSGKPDVVYANDIPADLGLVIDYKTGRGEVESAVGNLQLRALAVLAAQRWGFKRIDVAIIQPHAGPPSVCRYMESDLWSAWQQIEDLMSRVQQPGQPRNPSAEACKYCRAKAICPEAKAAAMAITQASSVEILTGGELSDMLDRCKLAEQVIDAIRTEARRRIDAGEEVPGWTLAPGAVRQEITDPQRVFSRFIEEGGTDAQFMAAVKVTKGALKDSLKAATGLKGKALDAELASILEGCTIEKPTASQLRKVKE